MAASCFFIAAFYSALVYRNLANTFEHRGCSETDLRPGELVRAPLTTSHEGLLGHAFDLCNSLVRLRSDQRSQTGAPHRPEGAKLVTTEAFGCGVDRPQPKTAATLLELEARAVLRAVAQLHGQPPAGILPRRVGLPDVGVLIRCGIVSQAAAARRD